MIRSGFVALCCGFLFFSFIQIAGAGMRPSAGNRVLIIKIRGAEFAEALKAFPREKGVREKVYPGDELVVGDEIFTPAAVLVQLGQWDGSTFNLGPNSQWKIESRVPEKQNYVSWTFSLARGALRGSVTGEDKKDAMKVKVKTPVGVMGVRGTEFLLVFAPESSMQVYTKTGEVLLGRSDKFEEGSFISVKENMMGEIGKDPSQLIAPPNLDPAAFGNGVKKSGLLDETPQGAEKVPQSISDCSLKGMGWRSVEGMGPLGECF